MDQFIVNEEFVCSHQIPSTYENAFSEHEKIAKLITYVNGLYNQFVTLSNTNTSLTTEYQTLITRINDYKTMLDNFIKGYTIPAGTITLEQLSFGIMEQLQEWVKVYMYDKTAFVSFGIEDGYFVAYIPETWTDLTFSTDLDGHLVLTF